MRAAQLIKVALPADARHGFEKVDRQSWSDESSKGEIDRFALRPGTVAAHDLTDEVIVELDVGTGHTPRVHILGVGQV